MGTRALAVLTALAAAMATAASAWAHHGGGHLPPTQANVDLVSRLQVSSVVPDYVTDVATYRDTAYLGAWIVRCGETPSRPGGFWTVDISDPATPRELGFTSAEPGTYMTEGMHAMRLTVPTFAGDVLIASRESCIDTIGEGGFAIYDVTNPAAPALLGESGDPDVRGALWNESHSAFGWDTGDKAYVVIADNNEGRAGDIDIFDVTDPRNPVLIKETGLAEWGPAQDNLAYGSQANVHDFVVRRVEGRWEMLVSYWDAGYVRLDVTDPANPRYISDSDYPRTDPLLPHVGQPEGNGHEAEFDRCPEEGVRSRFPCGDVRYILAADEDFSTARPVFRVTSGSNVGFYDAGEFSWTRALELAFPDGAEGPTVFGGSGCVEDVNGNGMSDRAEVPPASSIAASPGEEKIVVFERGTCFFSIKHETGQLAGYDVVLQGNHHIGAGSGLFPDAFTCGSQGHSPLLGPSRPGLCIGHRALHLLFNDAPEYTTPSTGAAADLPAIGTRGANVRAAGGVFDGWGYLNLIDADTMQHIDHYAISEALDERFERGFGSLTIHEITTDPTGDVGYIAWYGGGFRVVDYGRGDLREVGRYIAPEGNEFWGVELNVRRDGRLFTLASDTNYGLYIFRFGTDLRPTKVSSPRRTRVGNTFSYRIRVRNTGTITETATVVRDRLPRGVRFVSASATQGRCSYRRATRTVVCNLGRLVNDAQGAFATIRVRALRAGLVRNVATIQGRKTEYDIGNNTARATTRVLRARVAAPAGGRLTGGR
jgi:uncharacterized repeat protein (TIGR01451 family)